MAALGERMITVDCDVIQADGGTRTASITGGYVALALAIKELVARGQAKPHALTGHVAAISVGMLDNNLLLDLDYSMDSRAQVDMNVIMTGDGKFVEVQGTGENSTFDRDQLNGMLDLALGVLPTLVELQKRAIATELGPEPVTLRA
jgi:ribonuclease PH